MDAIFEIKSTPKLAFGNLATGTVFSHGRLLLMKTESVRLSEVGVVPAAFRNCVNLSDGNMMSCGSDLVVYVPKQTVAAQFEPILFNPDDEEEG